MTDWEPGLTGGAVEIGLIVLAGFLRLPRGFWWLAVGFSLAVCVLGGLVAGIGAPTRRAGRRRGLLSGLLGGVTFGAVLWYTMRTPGAPVGVFWNLNYFVATWPFPPGFAAAYDTAIPVALGALAAGVFVLVGTVVGGVASARNAALPQPSRGD